MQERPVTLEDVAALAGVSRQTVSRAVNGKPEISAATRARVLAAVKELGYKPNLFARGLVTRRSQTVGLVVGDLTNPFFPDVARGVMDEAEAHDLIVLVCNLGASWDTLKPLNALALRGVDGYIVFPAVADEAQITAFANTNNPMVVIDAPFTHPAISNVRIDWTKGGALAAEHIIDCGRTRPCMIGAHPDQAPLDRIDSFRTKAAELGVHIPDAAISAQDMTIDGGRRGMEALLGQGKDFDAVFAFNDLMAMGALQILTECGIKIPEEIAVLGCDNILLATHVTPSLTSVHVDRYSLGVAAMKQILQHIDRPEHVPELVTIDVTLSVKNSTRPT